MSEYRVDGRWDVHQSNGFHVIFEIGQDVAVDRAVRLLERGADRALAVWTKLARGHRHIQELAEGLPTLSDVVDQKAVGR